MAICFHCGYDDHEFDRSSGTGPSGRCGFCGAYMLLGGRFLGELVLREEPAGRTVIARDLQAWNGRVWNGRARNVGIPNGDIPDGTPDYGDDGGRVVARVFSQRPSSVATLQQIEAYRCRLMVERQVLEELGLRGVSGIARYVAHVSSETGGWIVSVRTYLPGRTLRSLLTGAGADEASAALLLWRLLRLVESVHRAGVAVGRIDGDSVLLALAPDQTWLPQLADFGHAAPVGPVRFRGGSSFDQTWRVAADLFGIGVVACEYLTGRPGTDVLALPSKVIDGPLLDAAPVVGKTRLRDVLRRLTAPDPCQRFASAAEAADAVVLTDLLPDVYQQEVGQEWMRGLSG